VTPTLFRRVGAELVGTAFLVMAVVGSGIAASRLSLIDVGLQLLENSLVTGAALVALILGQVSGGVLGAVVANLMFDLSPVSLASTDRSGSGPWLGEVVATLGPLLVVFGSLRRAARRAHAPGSPT
jgi:glycerol uptake facilitator-like aquaporin